MEILEKVAYLKGLADGMELGAETSKESKLLLQMLDLLEDVALEIQDMQDIQDELEEGLDAVSDDLSDVESYIYEMEDECCCGDDDGECCCDEDDEVCYETVCPNCEEQVIFDEDTLEEGYILCPNCGKKLEFDLEGSCGCGCGHHHCQDEDDDEEEED